MKKLVIITCLVAALVGGLVGGTALAAKTAAPAGTPVLMEANGGYVTVSANVTAPWQKVLDIPTPDYVHVSVTVLAQNLDDSDEVKVNVNFKGGNPEFATGAYALLTSCSTENMATKEFDAGRRGAFEFGDQPTTWSLWVHNSDGSPIDLWYTYTMTYPSTSTQNTQ
jgi:hypothetical protein